ncbi:hypothetical protein PITCH_A1640057 [uncultured Desulfobacterium sp.]|uniref:Uncharacterized protein n=1 Tax=uncultured Desulfobacterium sp. TaxID=201089 RepID=A0A445MU72_9BACT|nr:hypothetical protein PITCH_A1640057 [uncultured Desulfobacterium sp.]
MVCFSSTNLLREQKNRGKSYSFDKPTVFSINFRNRIRFTYIMSTTELYFLPHRTFVWVPPICCGRIIVFLTGMS